MPKHYSTTMHPDESATDLCEAIRRVSYRAYVQRRECDSPFMYIQTLLEVCKIVQSEYDGFLWNIYCESLSAFLEHKEITDSHVRAVVLSDHVDSLKDLLTSIIDKDDNDLAWWQIKVNAELALEILNKQLTGKES